MPVINVQGFSASQKTPGIYLAIVLGGPGTSAGAAPKILLLVGQGIYSNITGATPSFTVTAGTQPVNTPIQIFSPSDANTRFGAGSELHLMAIAAFGTYPQATVWALPTPNGTGAATGVITFTGAPAWTAAMTLRIVISGRFVDVPIATADTLTQIATNAAVSINQQSTLVGGAAGAIPNAQSAYNGAWPVTAQFAAGVLTITAKQNGLRANTITFRCFLISGATSVKATAGNLAITLNGLTATLSGGAVGGGTYRLTGGASNETLTSALATVASVKYDRYAVAPADNTSATAVNNQLTTMAAVTQQLRQQAIFCSNDTYANSTGSASNLNSPRSQFVWTSFTDMTPGEIAAAVAAARLIGDGQFGQRTIGEVTDPACNQDGLNLGMVTLQDVVSDIPIPTQIESALNNGLAVLAPSAALPGFMSLARSITTQFKDAQANPYYGVIDTQTVTVSDYTGDFIQLSLARDTAGTKLGVDDPSGKGPTGGNVITPLIVKSTIYGYLKDLESQFILVNVTLHQPQLQVIPDPTSQGRLLAEIPVVPIPLLHQIAGNVRQLSYP